MHSLRLMTLCKRVQNVPIIRIFLSWKHDNKWWKSIAKVAKSLRASGRCPEPRSLPSARPRELFRELDPTCRGSSAPTTPPQVNTFVPFGPWRGENFPWLSTIVKRNKQLTLSRVDELFTCFTQLWVDWEVKRVFFTYWAKQIRKSSWTTFCRFPLTHILPH